MLFVLCGRVNVGVRWSQGRILVVREGERDELAPKMKGQSILS